MISLHFYKYYNFQILHRMHEVNTRTGFETFRSSVTRI